jgi:hypothetical protein
MHSSIGDCGQGILGSRLVRNLECDFDRLQNFIGELAESIPSANEPDLDGRFDLDPKYFRDYV